ncbi:tetraacyldisaccharide 4'-kinase [Parvularcula flava]|uniref:Tetraacyldisaccharide 4'-kinase n=1 Tax=Aquisalinus luteolus TaxID=1566827 RepID=A0ABX0HN67_9PROT|nr:tetraacyldisaccharide 4'-kinase [Aquisalinus luteolus]NHK28664.1 tetraacyldisaccharide 4'-kinase [Aquisalinus luteolus]
MAKLLGPIASLYQTIDRKKRASRIPYRASGPVICVGNASMGGVGKTPFSILLSTLLAESGHKPGFLTRGYGGSEKGPVEVTANHTYAEMGDEALLLAHHGPVIVSRDREAGARMLFASQSADVLIMDDGFQNPSLVKDVSFLLVDAETGFGNGLVFPAGPLRETPEQAKARADAVVVVTRHAEVEIPADLADFAGSLPLFRAWLEPVAAEPGKVVAFCGIGRPAKFYATLERAGYTLAATRDFPDHHAWKAGDLSELQALAAQHDAPLITTQKDHVRLPVDIRDSVKTLSVRMAVDDPARLGELLAPRLGAAEKAGRTDRAGSR